MSSKRFRLPPEEIRPIVMNRGTCVASDRITVDGKKVGVLYREDPARPGDSGWTFLAGDEPPEYRKDARRFARYDVNTIANYDPDVIEFLDRAPGCEFARGADGRFECSRIGAPGQPQTITLPDAIDETGVSETWSVTLPGRFQRRIEGTSLVLWRSGLTVWVDSFATHDEPAASVAARVREMVPPNAVDLFEEDDATSWRCAYRIVEPALDRRRPALQGLVVAAGSFASLSIYFDDERERARAVAIWRSLRAPRELL